MLKLVPKQSSGDFIEKFLCGVAQKDGRKLPSQLRYIINDNLKTFDGYCYLSLLSSKYHYLVMFFEGKGRGYVIYDGHFYVEPLISLINNICFGIENLLSIHL